VHPTQQRTAALRKANEAHHHIFDRIYIVLFNDHRTQFQDPNFEYVRPLEGILSYVGLEDDFGPMDLGKMFEFCQAMDVRLKSTDRPVALMTSLDSKVLTNTVFVLGAFMLLKFNKDLDTAIKCLEPVLPKTVAYKNVSRSSAQTFELSVEDCLRGLLRAKRAGWVDFGPDGFDVDEYRHLDNPLNADLHEIIPGKLVLMRGPRDLHDGALWRDGARADGCFSHRDFSPAHYADILAQLDVRAVVRCNAPLYDRAGFEGAGIAVVDLCCEDGAPPPVDVVAKFLAVAERIPGAIAVHCGSGRGRSGTLAALYMMKHHGFTAREAIGWLRIVRPGRWASPPRPPTPSPLSGGARRSCPTPRARRIRIPSRRGVRRRDGFSCRPHQATSYNIIYINYIYYIIPV
jgi:cell division cycle 14